MGEGGSPYDTGTGKREDNGGRGTSVLTRLGFCEAMRRKTDLGHRGVNRGCTQAHTHAHVHTHRTAGTHVRAHTHTHLVETSNPNF